MGTGKGVEVLSGIFLPTRIYILLARRPLSEPALHSLSCILCYLFIIFSSICLSCPAGHLFSFSPSLFLLTSRGIFTGERSASGTFFPSGSGILLRDRRIRGGVQSCMYEVPGAHFSRAKRDRQGPPFQL